MGNMLLPDHHSEENTMENTMAKDFIASTNTEFQDLLKFTAKWPYAKVSQPDSWVGDTEYLDECQLTFDLLNEEMDGNIYKFELSDGRVGLIGRNRVIYTRYAPGSGQSDVVVAHNYKGPKGGGPEYAKEVLEFFGLASPKKRIQDAARALLEKGVMKDRHNPDKNQPGMPISEWKFGLLRNWRGVFLCPVKSDTYTSLSQIQLEQDGYAWIQKYSVDGAVTAEGEHRLMGGSVMAMMSLEDIINL